MSQAFAPSPGQSPGKARGLRAARSDFIRMALVRVAHDKAVPFAVKVPNAETRQAMEEARTMRRARFASAGELFDALEKDRER